MEKGKELYEYGLSLDEDAYYVWRDGLSEENLGLLNDYRDKLDRDSGPIETHFLTREQFATGKPFAQGELRMWLKEFSPFTPDEKNLNEVKAENGLLIVAHSESGHHHAIEVMERPNKTVNAQRLIDSTNELIAVLKINEESRLIHHRANDTHAAYVLPPGEYVCRTDAEYTPEGFRKVVD